MEEKGISLTVPHREPTSPPLWHFWDTWSWWGGSLELSVISSVRLSWKTTLPASGGMNAWILKVAEEDFWSTWTFVMLCLISWSYRYWDSFQVQCKCTQNFIRLIILSGPPLILTGEERKQFYSCTGFEML